MSRSRTDARSSVTGAMPAVVILGVLGWLVWYVVFHRTPAVAPGRVELSRLSARRAQEAVAQNGIAGGAAAAMKELAEQAKLPADQPSVQLSLSTAYGMALTAEQSLAPADPANPPPAIRLSGVASSEPTDAAGAVASAVRQAREKLGDVFAALRSPIREVPSEDELLKDYVPASGITVRLPTDADRRALLQAGLGTDRVWKVVTVTVSEEQLRQLRARQRLGDLGRWAAVALAVLAIAYGMLRADDRSGGYFTWLWAVLGLAASGGMVALAVTM